ncbi:hypothetical protein FD754_015637 [Muntiacus muntjak]|uniref:Calponin-homology (CH) domain-containing protein n=1 Tax=Muntiacus muntjak TaxID=9888 RepID=A0A5N3VN66_MUNMU|nr:hypothetical protein FD754_015637 [Muntiacus muntjak]
MILSGRNDAPARGHGHSDTAAPHPTPATKREKRKFLPPTSRNNPKFEELQKVLMDWINAELLPEHIVVRSLEEDIFDGLILHHLFQKLSGLKLDVEEIALTAASQRRKLTAVLESVGQSLQVEEPQAKWSVESIFSKDLLATLHLLVALAKRFQPDLPLPTNVQVEVITMERTKSGLKSEKSVEQLTECGCVSLGKSLPLSELLHAFDKGGPPFPTLNTHWLSSEDLGIFIVLCKYAPTTTETASQCLLEGCMRLGHPMRGRDTEQGFLTLYTTERLTLTYLPGIKALQGPPGSLAHPIPCRRAWQPTPVFLLENSMDRGAWRASVHGIPKSRTQLKRLSNVCLVGL